MHRTALSAALLRSEPAGFVATSTAGAVQISARLQWRRAGDVPDLAPPAGLGVRRVGPATLEISGELRALSEGGLSAVAERALERISCAAALSGAVLEVRATRSAAPVIPQREVLEELALLLRGLGLRVRLGPSWETVRGGEVALGVRGMEEVVKERLARELGLEVP
ncbi:hypothetical protein [Rubrobacter taiwanensis]|jgi:hypothetical protein|uniref:hypothetical protein n=1 Tax=Rubrobacter taiwanensis TaxID=185139 RepID=UPI0014043A4F|nr:hypothetical protein [Rubrobacter taiwanensis]